VQRLVLVSVKQRGDEVNAEASLIQLEPAKLISNKSVTLNLLSSNFLTQADAFITSLYRTVNIPPAEGGKKGDGPVAQVHCNTDTDCTSGEVCDTASARCIPYAPEADRFYQKWWFWAILGGSLAVAGGTGVLIWYFTQPQRGAIEFTF
jgi:Cys-rich repeat protein